jgi:hypothetical protein
MRKTNGQFAKGHTGNPLGRPKRADEQFLLDLWSEHGQVVFSHAVERGEQWAVKLLMDKLYPNKRDVEARINMETPKLSITFDQAFANGK